MPVKPINNKYDLIIKSNQHWKDVWMYRGNGRYGTFVEGLFDNGENFLVYHVTSPSVVYLIVNGGHTPVKKITVRSDDITSIRRDPGTFMEYVNELLDEYTQEEEICVCKNKK